jgi:hypothetical protein
MVTPIDTPHGIIGQASYFFNSDIPSGLVGHDTYRSGHAAAPPGGTSRTGKFTWIIVYLLQSETCSSRLVTPS